MRAGDPPTTLALPAHAIAEAVRGGRLAPDAAVREHLRQIAGTDRALGAFQPVSYTHLTLPTNREV